MYTPVKEHRWGQRVVRFYDPDRHIIEVGGKYEGGLQALSGQWDGARPGRCPNGRTYEIRKRLPAVILHTDAPLVPGKKICYDGLITSVQQEGTDQI